MKLKNLLTHPTAPTMETEKEIKYIFKIFNGNPYLKHLCMKMG